MTHAALAALDETHGGPQGQRWEELSDNQRTEKTHQASGHETRFRKGIHVRDVSGHLPEKERLREYISAGISDAFAQYEQDLAGGGNKLDGGGAMEAQLWETTIKDDVDTRNRQKLQGGTSPGQVPPPANQRQLSAEEPQNIAQASHQADQQIAAYNKRHMQAAQDQNQEQRGPREQQGGPMQQEEEPES